VGEDLGGFAGEVGGEGEIAAGTFFLLLWGGKKERRERGREGGRKGGREG